MSSSNKYRYDQQFARYQSNKSQSYDGIRESKTFYRRPLARDSPYNNMTDSNIKRSRQMTMQ